MSRPTYVFFNKYNLTKDSVFVFYCTRYKFLNTAAIFLIDSELQEPTILLVIKFILKKNTQWMNSANY